MGLLRFISTSTGQMLYRFYRLYHEAAKTDLGFADGMLQVPLCSQKEHREPPGKQERFGLVHRISTSYLLLSQILPFPFRKSGTIEWHLSSRRHLRVSTHQNNLLSKPGTNSFHPISCHMLLSKLHELFRQHVGTFWLTMSRAIFFIALCHWHL